MTKGKVAVDGYLGSVREMLQEKGYEIVPMDQLTEADAVVVSGGDYNMMGVETTLTKAPVIQALGMTPDEVIAAVERRARR
ncbi:MAG: YkuS family protein [Bacillota bacterium]|jgi:imidazolonepropionase-like amidohydrolase